MMKQMRAEDKDERKCSVNETEKVENRVDVSYQLSSELYLTESQEYL